MEQARLQTELNTLERKVQLLLNEFQLVKDELTHLKAENQELKLALKQKDERIKDFQNQDKISKIVGTIGKDEAETSEMREKIDEYIKEIDKCILHLTR
jgi:regulator of replication initiation timing